MAQHKDVKEYDLNKTAPYRHVKALIEMRDSVSSIMATEEEMQDVLTALRYRNAELDSISVDEALFGSRDPSELRHERIMKIADNKKCEIENPTIRPFTLFGIPIMRKDGTQFEIVHEGSYPDCPYLAE